MSEKKYGGYLDFLSESFEKMAESHVTDFSVGDLLEDSGGLELTLRSDRRGLARRILAPKVQKLGLALAGHADYIDRGRIQLLGRAEIAYLNELGSEARGRALDAVIDKQPACLLIARDLPMPDGMAALCEAREMAVLSSPLTGACLGERLGCRLERNLALGIKFHGTQVVVMGTGVLLLGKSGVGKSECALDLVTRGHQLVCDDMVHVWRDALGRLIGRSDPHIRHIMNIHGLGMVNIEDLFSLSATVNQHTIHLAVYLEPWSSRKGLPTTEEEERETFEVLEVPLDLVRIPVAPGRNLSTLIEVAVRNFHVKQFGLDPRVQLTERLARVFKDREKKH